MSRRALVVGINSYSNKKILPELGWCINDARAMCEVLQHHENGEPNFDCHLLLGIDPEKAPTDLNPAQVTFDATFNGLRKALEDLFAFEDTVLLYFSGHGSPSPRGRYLAAQDGTPSVPGIHMNDVLTMANQSPARNVILIIDSCFSGWMGEQPTQAESGGTWDIPNVYLRDGVTILAAARPEEYAIEIGGHGVFTRLVMGALKGGAADVRGRVSAASIYAYVEQALGPWQQRPVYKSNASELAPLRFCRPDISDEELRLLPHFFPAAESQFEMDPTYEVTSPSAVPGHVQSFRTFKHYQVARLLRPVFAYDADLFFVAIRSHKVELTPLGQFYWQLATDQRLSGSPAFTPPRSSTVIDAESIAKLFHETYERLAPYYNYETREATRTTWESVPENNKRLMIAVATEVLATLASAEAAAQSASPPPPAREE